LVEALKLEKKKMKISKPIISVFIVFALAVIGVSAHTQRRSSRITDQQVSSILQRLEQSSNRFRGSLNTALIQERIDQTRPQNDINSFEPAFGSAIDQFRDRFARRLAVAADVQNILQKASLVNGFMTRNRLNTQVQNDWASVRTDLNALANAYGVSWQWNGQTLPPVNSSRSSRLSDRELNQLIQRLETGEDKFRSSLTGAFGQGRYDQTTSEGNMNEAVQGLKYATDQLRNQFDRRQPVADYVERVLARATPIDTYVRNNRLTNRAQNDWSTLRRDLTTLAGAYNVSANWQNGPDPRPPQAGYTSDSRLSGTFRLDSSRSDNPRDVADRVTQSLANNERQGVSDRVLARLESPEMLAIERHGSTMTIASSRAPQSTFEADGIEHQEQNSNGRTTRVTATLRGEQLAVKSTGYRENDFTVTFDSIENGDRLRVRREIYSDRLSQPIVVNSIYNRTSTAAQWNVYDGSGQFPGNTGATGGEFIVRDGETVVAVLNNDLTTKDAKQGDRFTMTVREPGQYEGAVIEGTLGSVDQSGRLTGRAGMTLNFDTLRLRTGQTYRFAGILESVRTVNGDTVRVDNEGSAQGGNQTTQTIQRTAIGTAIGAIIGAIAGGGKGAAIGGIIGAAGGAGSVYVQGKDNLELLMGTELTIRASAPR
jgi:outer membrane lipoprotein SlyB